MADLSDSDIFDSVISGSNAEPGDKQEPTPQPRDLESGRFAAKEPEPPVQAVAPVVEPQAPTPEAPSPGGMPVSAVKGERERRQAAEADAEALRREIAELRGMVQATRQPAPQPQQEKQPSSIFEDPEAYLKDQLNPFQQSLQEIREELWESRATVIHTAEAVDAAKAAADALDPASKAALHRHITANGNPFDNLVKWHKQQQTFARVGNDPDAWLNAEIEKRMQDPQFLAQAVERARAGVSPTPQTRQPVTSIPPSLSRLPAGGNVPQGGEVQSDDALFSATTSGRRGKR